jgi:hypothetical protein
MRLLPYTLSPIKPSANAQHKIIEQSEVLSLDPVDDEDTEEYEPTPRVVKTSSPMI